MSKIGKAAVGTAVVGKDEENMFNVDTLVVDRVLRVTMFDNASSEVIFTADQIENPSLECGGEQVVKNDATGAPIATFDRSKTSKFSAESSVLNLSMAAAQFGSRKEVASAAGKLRSPKFEILSPDASGELALSAVPVGTPGAEIRYVYLLNKDKSISRKFEVGADAAENFSVSAAEQKITLPTGAGAQPSDRFAVWYEYETEAAVRVANDGNRFPRAGRFDVEVLFADICNQDVKYYGHIVFPKGKLDSNVTFTLTSEGNHPLSFTGMSDYCDDDKNQFYYIVPQE